MWNFLLLLHALLPAEMQTLTWSIGHKPVGVIAILVNKLPVASCAITHTDHTQSVCRSLSAGNPFFS